MWQYSQSTGRLLKDSIFKGVGYSGHLNGLNSPEHQTEIGIGPIPQGVYSIGTFFDHPHLGPCVAHLGPASETNTFGRSGFFIHGDNRQMNHTASDGCIILDHDLRGQIQLSNDRQLTVTE